MRWSRSVALSPFLCHLLRGLSAWAGLGHLGSLRQLLVGRVELNHLQEGLVQDESLAPSCRYSESRSQGRR